MRARKVIHVITRLDRGGSAQNTLLTALGHDRRRFAPLVVAGTAGAWDAQGGRDATLANARRLEESGVPCRLLEPLTRPISPLRDAVALGLLVRLFRAERPALVHTHTSKAGVLGRLAARLAGVPAVIHTPHGHVFYGHVGPLAAGVFLRIERRLARRTTRLIALTEAERDEHVRRGVGTAAQFAVIPSGIDLARVRDLVGVKGPCPPGLACPPDARLVGSVGWLTPVKGHRTLLDACARLAPTFPRLHLLLVGSGPLRAALEAQARQLGLAAHVTFAGERDDVRDCLAALDVFVQPSLNEGMGRALIEAMAAGRPVIASRVGGIPALIEDRRTGRLVPPADPAALAEALAELLRRPDWAKELGAAAAASIGPQFGVASMVEAIEELYEQALGSVSR